MRTSPEINCPHTNNVNSLPPGPPTIPILGNAHQIPGQNVEKKFKEWADIYGPIYSLKIGAGTLILLNDKRTVHDLLDKRSAIYSERPNDQQMSVALAENFAFWNTSPAWRSSRKIAAHFVSPKNLDENIMGVQEAESDTSTPAMWFGQLTRTEQAN